jgi:large conductance mechanosensitive channel
MKLNPPTDSRSIVTEFRNFALRGNIFELAVGIIIGTAFTKVVSSLVSDIIMPPLSILLAGINIKEIKLLLQPTIMHKNSSLIHEAVTWNIGSFLQSLVDFIIVACALFLIIKLCNTLIKADISPPTNTLSKQEKLLTEVRDLLKNTKK